MPRTPLRHHFLRALYTATMYLVTPVILYRLAVRGLRHRGYFERWRERFGYFPSPRLERTIWVHAVSVGEVNAAAPLIDALRRHYPDHAVAVTTVTPTGSNRVRQLWGDKVFHVYLPYDLPAAVRRFLDRLQPCIAVIMETEIWPNLYLICEKRRIPIMLANARLSEKSLRGYGPAQPLAAEAVQRIRFVAAQSQPDFERFLALGVQREQMEVVGNLKFDMRVPEGLDSQAVARRSRWGKDRPVWIAASTHEGEELPVIEAHSRVLNRFPDALLLIAPRHPERFRPMIQLCRAHGFATATRSEQDLPDLHSQCFVIDSLGELVDFLACADAAFVAGSFEPIGGHNALEPAALGVPVLVGPHTFNFAEVTDLLLDRGAAIRVADPAELAASLHRLFRDDTLRRDMGRAAVETVRGARGAVGRTVERIAAILGPGRTTEAKATKSVE
ncbi:MAG: lipid IV(A) 3-deoxy-D-manno-octulosonic acid transferase [Xanthomonadales bacterium]|nr:lipid IV(A) 3-deoxy-D-manno-octulosonic acid transferase [Xanthomonadales bacterium]